MWQIKTKKNRILALLLSTGLGGQAAPAKSSSRWQNAFDRLSQEQLIDPFFKGKNPGLAESQAVYTKLLATPGSDPELSYLAARELAGYTEDQTRSSCHDYPPRAHDYYYQAICLAYQHEKAYADLKVSLLEILEKSEKAEPNTNLYAKTASTLSDISSANNDNFLSLKILEKALQLNPKEDLGTFYAIKTKIAYLYTTPSNHRQIIEKGLAYFAEAEAYSRKMGLSLDADLSLYNQAITYIFAFKDYTQALETLQRIDSKSLGLEMDKKIFSAFCLMKLGRHQEARQTLASVRLEHYDDPSRIPFLTCYQDIVRYVTKDITDPKSCGQLPLDTQVDVLEHITLELSSYPLPEDTEIAIWRQYYRFYKEKIEPTHQTSFDQSATDLEVEQAKYEAALRKMEAEAQSLRLEAERRQNQLTLVLLSGLFVMGGLSYVLFLTRRHSLHLEEAERARTLFFHNTSHELRTPLNGIIGFVELVCQGQYGELHASAKAQLGKALRLAESLKIQVNTILDLAKSKRGELDLKIQRFSLEELMNEADSLAEGLSLRAHELSYSSELSGLQREFIGDREKIFTILRNLLGNAFKFRDHQRPNRVECHLHAEGGRLRIEVSDTGIGIPKEFQERIYDAFAQVQSDARRSYEGTGLGLSMVRDIVELMGGRIELYSRPGEGSRFVVNLPESKPEAILTSLPVTPNKGSRASFPDLSPLNRFDFSPASASPSHNAHAPAIPYEILVIDDNESNCEVIVGILQADGYHLSSAVSGREGLKRMKAQRPHLLLLDMMMPEMSGEDVMQAMRADPDLADIPVILITARASEEDRIEGLRLGADDYLPKPIFAAELRLRVRNKVERHELLRQMERALGEAKIVQLGEMFSELSHELKNILQSSYGIRELALEDGLLSSAILDLDDTLREAYAGALIAPSRVHNIMEVESRLHTLIPNPSLALSHETIGLLLTLDLSWEHLERMYRNLQSLSSEELAYITSQMRLFWQYKILLQSTLRSRDLTESVLSYSRTSAGPSTCQISAAWHQTEVLLRAMKPRKSVHWKVQLSPVEVLVSQGALTQILLNLSLNALDALEALEETERWIQLETTLSEDFVVVRLSNAGAPIPRQIQKQLFERGYSTKGEQGSGIGLFVSRRLAHQSGGELTYDALSDHPCFELRLPRPSVRQVS